MRSAGGSRLAQIGFLKESLSFDAVRTSPARSARPSAPRSRRPTAAGVAVPCVGRGERRATRDGRFIQWVHRPTSESAAGRRMCVDSLPVKG